MSETLTVYCFVNAAWGDDVVAVAVCGICGTGIGSHVSSDEAWAKHDIMSEHHAKHYLEHAREAHRLAGVVEMRWLKKPLEVPELVALMEFKA